ncbi:MAG: hypothetical protein LBG44_07215, partial [Gemmatimonadota bacterium]|nr:hypothetical protein [Gemmatimonadota bacterium]
MYAPDGGDGVASLMAVLGPAGTSGTAQYKVTYSSEIYPNGVDYGSFSITWISRNRSVSVTPGSEPVTMGAGTTGTQLFTVKNTGGESGIFNLTVTGCGAVVTSCSLSRSVMTLAPGISDTTRLSYKAGSLGSPATKVWVTAQLQGSYTVTASGNVIVNMGTVAVTPVGGATRQGQPGVADSVTFT